MRFTTLNHLLYFSVMSLILAGCRQPADPPIQTGDPMTDRLTLAHDEAEQWDENVVLTGVSSHYVMLGGELIFKNYSYLFVSTNGTTSYYVVHIHDNGEVRSNLAAGKAFVDPIIYDLEKNDISEQDALDRAWLFYGADLVEECGSLRWVDVSGGVDQVQWWSVSYDISGMQYTIFMDASTGEILEMDEANCSD